VRKGGVTRKFRKPGRERNEQETATKGGVLRKYRKLSREDNERGEGDQTRVVEKI
jgi:hypothetical protein